MIKFYKPYTGYRFIAALIDYSIVWGFFMYYIIIFGTPDNAGEYTINGWPALVPVLFWFIYIVCFEQLFGSTLGNGIAGLKPLTLSGHSKPSFVQSLQRHVLDPVDMFFFGLPAIITLKNTGQRVGDLWAKTIVVKYRHGKQGSISQIGNKQF